MRTKLNLTGLVMTGAATLFVGLAGSVQAIPIVVRNHTTALHATTTHQVTGSMVQSNPNQILTTLVSASHLSASTSVHNASSHHVAVLNHRAPGITVPVGGTLPGGVLPKPLPSGTNQIPVTISTAAPDGGTTAAMLGAAFCGLVLLRTKLKV